jgi:hypothetical protein
MCISVDVYSRVHTGVAVSVPCIHRELSRILGLEVATARTIKQCARTKKMDVCMAVENQGQG